jgi:peptidase E
MAARRILATSGGFVRGTIQGTVRVGEMLTWALAQTGKTRPRVCVVLTATGDDASYYAATYEALNCAGCDVTELRLFTQPSAEPTERLCSSDLVWVGGGSVANLLALWRLHGVDEAMAAAWEAGVILSGVSAGSLCWHVGGTTDSFGPTLRPVLDGLGLLPYANGVHFDSESQRRPLLHELVASGVLPEVAYATDDSVGIWYEGTEPTCVLTDGTVDPASGPAAYRIERRGDASTETRLSPGPISG